MKEIILASSSPRRKELLEQLQIPFSILPSTIEEKIEGIATPADIVMLLALQKANDIAQKHKEAVVIGADTIVTYDEKILGKPTTEQEAYSMLHLLSGKTHEVFTGVAILYNEEQVTFYERTEVTFYDLTDEEIYSYIESGEPMDKAGSYGIQGLGAEFVKKINGDYFSVVGLPVARVKRQLKSMGML